jgi:putative membrane protein
MPFHYRGYLGQDVSFIFSNGALAKYNDMTIRPFRTNTPLQLIVAWLAVLWIVTAIDPLFPRDWLLENLLVFTWSALLALSYRRFQFSNLSYFLFTVFLSLHLVGAHYTYSETPFGFWMQDLLGFERNHYDRLVHFAFGLLLVYPMREILLRRSGVNKSWSYFLAVNCVVAFSAVYEMLEMIAAMLVSPELGAAYLGTQGDEWDAQKDALLAFVGAIIAMLATRRFTRDA